MPAGLNLSNEVVKMRAEVKRVKVLIIRKLTRQIAALKKKKGSEADLERNQRRAARLLEEIHVLKSLAPDSVTKAALQSDISFEKVCQKKESSLAERATARIATHPEFGKKIQSIKNAVKAFKAERISAERKEKKSKKDEQQEKESGLDSDNEEGSDDDDDDDDDDEEDEDDSKADEADEEQLNEPTKQNKDPVTATESPSETPSVPAEVVRMRKEVKKLRVLIIRNLTQQIATLKKVKAEDPEMKGNVECAARLQEEVQVLRALLPDHVTTSALEGSIDMEKVLQDPESSVSERAIARIATHARFVKKLQDVKQAIEEEKIKAAKAGGESKNDGEMIRAEDSDGEVEDDDDEEAGDDSDDDNDDDEEEDSDNGEEEKQEEEEDKASDDSDEEEKEKVKLKETNPTLKELEPPRSNVTKPLVDTKLAPAKEKPKGAELEKPVRTPLKPKSISKPAVKAVQSPPSKSKEAAPQPPGKHVSKPDTKKPEPRKKEAEESDLSDSEEEKEYFDDSTEERFHKQSSYSEESEDDDFFLGKVSKLKKKKSDTAPRPEKTNDSDKPREKEVKETPQFRMQSIFCSTLSKSNTSSQKGKHSAPPFQKQKHEEKPSWVKSQGPGRERRPPGFRNQTPGSGRGEKTGRPAFDRKNAPANKAGKPSQQALHPSWEASRKRKEQQAQITAFQGKKIKFDDDD